MRLFYHFTFGVILNFIVLVSFAQSSYTMGGQSVTDTAGYLYDPGGPTDNYYDSTVVTFTIDVGPGKTLKLQWLEFELESNDVDMNLACYYDYVEIFEGTDTLGSPLNRYCGSDLPPNFEATSGKITIRLTTDQGSSYAGFKAYWTTGAYLPPPTGGGGTPTGYCPADVGQPCYISAIKRFALSNINNDNNLCDKENLGSGLDDGYSDYTQMLVQLDSGTTYTVQVEIFSSLIIDNAQLWIDWNNDSIWSLTERIQLVGEGWQVNLFVGAVTVPTDAVMGKVGRIRVISDFQNPITDPCAATYSGEVEDYSFIVPNGDVMPACVSYANATPSHLSTDNCLKQTLRWPKVASATSYLVSLRDLSTGALLVNNFSVTDTFLVLPTTLSSNRNYRWIAQSVNGTTPGFMCDSADFTTSANLDPIANIIPTGNPVQACLNVALNLDGNPSLGTSPYTHTWSGSGATSLNTTSSQTPVFTGTTVGNYKLFYETSDDNNCKALDSIDIEVITGANAGTISTLSPSTVCQGVPISIKVVGSSGTIIVQDSVTGGTWTDMTTTQINDSVFNVSESSIGTVYFRIRAEGVNCSQTGTSTISHTVMPAPIAPVVSLVGNDTICSGTTMMLVVSNYTDNLVWNDNATTQNDTLVVNSTGTYKATYVGANCPSFSVPIDIFVAPIPTALISADGNLTACADNPPFLFTNPSTTETVLWNTGATTKGIIPTVTDDYSAIITNEFGCSKTTGTLSVVINPVPPKPFITLIGSANPCQGEPVVLKSNYVGGNRWNTGAVTDSITATNSGDFWVTFTNSFGCSTKSDTTKITFRPAPTKPNITVTGKVNTCNGDSVKLSVNTTPASTWNDANATVNNTLIVYKSGSYYARYVNTDGCIVYSDTVTTTFKQLQPEMKITVTGNNFCEGNVVLLSVNTPNGNTWNDASGNRNDSLYVSTSGNYFVRNVANGVCTAYSDTVNIVFEAKPAQPSIIKSNDTLYSSITGSGYQWLDNSGPISNSNNRHFIPNHTADYQVIVYSSKGCASDPSASYYIGFTGIAEQQTAKAEITPNPFDSYLNVDRVESDQAIYILTNQMGQVVLQGKLKTGNNTLEINLSSGIYNLIVNDNGKYTTARIVKK